MTMFVYKFQFGSETKHQKILDVINSAKNPMLDAVFTLIAFQKESGYVSIHDEEMEILAKLGIDEEFEIQSTTDLRKAFNDLDLNIETVLPVTSLITRQLLEQVDLTNLLEVDIDRANSFFEFLKALNSAMTANLNELSENEKILEQAIQFLPLVDFDEIFDL